MAQRQVLPRSARQGAMPVQILE